MDTQISPNKEFSRLTPIRRSKTSLLFSDDESPYDFNKFKKSRIAHLITPLRSKKDIQKKQPHSARKDTTHLSETRTPKQPDLDTGRSTVIPEKMRNKRKSGNIRNKYTTDDAKKPNLTSLENAENDHVYSIEKCYEDLRSRINFLADNNKNVHKHYESEIDYLSSELESKTRAIEEIKENQMMFDKEKKDLERKVTLLKNQKNDKILRLKSKIEELLKDKLDLQKKYKKHTQKSNYKKMNDLNKKLLSKSKDLNMTEKKLLKANNELVALIRRLSGKISLVDKTIGTKNKEIEELETSKEQLSLKKTNLTMEFDKIEKYLDEAEKEGENSIIKNFREEFRFEGSKKESTRNDTDLYKSAIAMIARKLNLPKVQENSSIEEEARSLTDRTLKAVCQLIKNSNTNAIASKQNVPTNKATEETHNAQLKEKNEEIRMLRNQLEAVQSNTSVEKDQMGILKNESLLLKIKVESLIKKSLKDDAKNRQLEQDLVSSRKEFENSVKDLKKKLRVYDEKELKDSENVLSVNKKVESLEEELKKSKSLNNAYEAQVHEIKDLYQKEMDKTQQIEKNFNSLKEDFANLEKLLESNKQTICEKEAEIENLKIEKEKRSVTEKLNKELAQSNEENGEKIRDLEKKLAEQKAELETHSELVSGKNQKLGHTRELVAALKADYHNLRLRFESAENMSSKRLKAMKAYENEIAFCYNKIKQQALELEAVKEEKRVNEKQFRKEKAQMENRLSLAKDLRGILGEDDENSGNDESRNDEHDVDEMRDGES